VSFFEKVCAEVVVELRKYLSCRLRRKPVKKDLSFVERKVAEQLSEIGGIEIRDHVHHHSALAGIDQGRDIRNEFAIGLQDTWWAVFVRRYGSRSFHGLLNCTPRGRPF
jgi:hypothetical protein